MEHKCKLRELVDASQALRELADTRLRGSTAFLIARIVRVVNIELDSFDAGRKAIFEKFGVAEGQEVGPDQKVEAEAEFGKLLDTELTLTFEPVPIELLNDVEIKPSVLVDLGRFLKEDN